ncbi:unnamed protein product [Coregonus sp. 'balchen']|nr:unnamed protein product [Coregonus sp. 'balchen']
MRLAEGDLWHLVFSDLYLPFTERTMCHSTGLLKGEAVSLSPQMEGGNGGLGRPGVDCYSQHESGAAVLQLQFLINEGALVTACADETLHLWNLRQRRPAILHSLKFNRERLCTNSTMLTPYSRHTPTQYLCLIQGRQGQADNV